MIKWKMLKVKNPKKPYSFSIRSDLIDDIVYFKKTIINSKLDQQVEDFIRTLVPARNDTDNI